METIYQSLFNRKYDGKTSKNLKDFHDYNCLQNLVTKWTDYRTINGDENFIIPEVQVCGCFNGNANYSTMFTSGDDFGYITVIDTSEGSDQGIKERSKIHTRSVTSLSNSDNGLKLLSSSASGDIYINDVVTSSHIIKLGKAHEGGVEFASWSLWSNDIFASCGRDGNFNVWDIRVDSSGKETPVSIAFIDSKQISPITPLCEFPHKRTRGLNSVRRPVSCIRFLSVRENIIASVCKTNSRILLWDLRYIRNEKTYLAPPKNKISLLTFAQYSGTSQLLDVGYFYVVDDNRYFYAGCVDKSIYRYNLSKLYYGEYTQNDPLLLPEQINLNLGSQTTSYCSSSISISPDGDFITTGAYNPHPLIWSTSCLSAPLFKLSILPSMENISRINFCHFSSLTPYLVFLIVLLTTESSVPLQISLPSKSGILSYKHNHFRKDCNPLSAESRTCLSLNGKIVIVIRC